MVGTFTRTSNVIHFADPYKVCIACGGWVDGVRHLPDMVSENLPCEHRAAYRDACPSWGPVDGCRCVEVLGALPHPPRPSVPDGKVS